MIAQAKDDYDQHDITCLQRLLVLEQRGLMLCEAADQNDPEFGIIQEIAEGHRRRAQQIRHLLLESGAEPPAMPDQEQDVVLGQDLQLVHEALILRYQHLTEEADEQTFGAMLADAERARNVALLIPG